MIAGFLDQVVGDAQLSAASAAAAQRLAALDLKAHLSTKQRVRSALLRELRVAIEEDDADLTRQLAIRSSLAGRCRRCRSETGPARVG